jgi:oxygen-dependent protoporphyrinogen oxidase
VFSAKPSVAVIGGGIAGLVATYELVERAGRFDRGIDVRCYEATDRVGGNIRTTSEDGFLCEWGATGFLDNAPETITLIRRLGLEERSVKARDIAARRFIYRKGKLREVPLGPGAFLTSSILSPWGKLRLLGEPFVPGRRSAETESVFAFAERRIGRAAASILVDAMVSGVYAGDSRRLALETTFPKMRSMESDHGSLFRAMLARRKTAPKGGEAGGGPAGPGGRLISFRDGLQELIDTLARAIGPRLCLESPIARVTHMGARGFRLHPSEGAPFEVDAVIVACPAWHAAPLLQAMDPTLGQALDEIPSAAVAVVHLGYRRDALGPQPEGFGFLVPRGQGPRILGALWPSCMFEGRAPEGSRLFTVMIGGAHDPEGARLDDAKLMRLARTDLQLTMGIHANPYFVRVIHHPRGIPQYEMGHRDRLQTIDSRLEETPGLWIAGNSLRGVAINSCVAEAPGVAEAALAFLERRASTAAI